MSSSEEIIVFSVHWTFSLDIHNLFTAINERSCFVLDSTILSRWLFSKGFFETAGPWSTSKVKNFPRILGNVLIVVPTSVFGKITRYSCKNSLFKLLISQTSFNCFVHSEESGVVQIYLEFFFWFGDLNCCSNACKLIICALKV